MIGANGNFSLSTNLAAGSSYNVVIDTQPPGQNCAVTNGTGTIGTAAVSNIVITCQTAVERVLYSFPDQTTDGYIGLISAPVLGHDGNFYGVTSMNGPSVNSSSPGQNGAVYQLTPSGTLTAIFNFPNPSVQGSYPYALIQGADGNLYGVTLYGGQHGYGTLFKLTTSGVQTVIYSFGAYPNDGVLPISLIQGADGNFYGTTQFGGNNGENYCFAETGFRTGPNSVVPVCTEYGYGTVFKITPAGQETILHSFGEYATDATFGGPLIQGGDGNLYGTTMSGGSNGSTICSIYGSPFNSGTACQSQICVPGTAACTPYVCQPQTVIGGYNLSTPINTNCMTGYGTVYKVSLTGEETVLYSFGASASDGIFPTTLIQGTDGNIYGTTLLGGANGADSCSAQLPAAYNCMPGYGIFFKVTPVGRETELYSFGANQFDGRNPAGVIIQAIDGNFYGTTPYGGANRNTNFNVGSIFGSYVGSAGAPSNGTIYRISPAGDESVIHSFSATETDIINPNLGVFLSADGTIYGAGTFMNTSFGQCDPLSGLCYLDGQGGFFVLGSN